jgi:Fur family peroxide stress response transcriptional regulator
MPTLKYSRQREAIKTFLAGRTDHPTADTVYTCLRETYPNISLGTVYRNLALLEQIGEITRISTGSNAEHYDADTSPHQHFICSRCHRVYDVHMNDLHSMIDAASGSVPGTIDSCRINFYGVCSECSGESRKQ